MRRSLAEWIGRTDDTPVPPRVRLRVLERFGRRCDPGLGCGRPLRPGDAWTCDHIEAIINGGANRESNLHPLCEWCEPLKTEADVHEKSRSYRRRLRHAGIKVAPKGRPVPGTIASGWKHRMDGGWERRIVSSGMARACGHRASHSGKTCGMPSTRTCSSIKKRSSEAS
jgi:5-methylcytosine-specific restriction protein A